MILFIKASPSTQISVIVNLEGYEFYDHDWFITMLALLRVRISYAVQVRVWPAVNVHTNDIRSAANCNVNHILYAVPKPCLPDAVVGEKNP